MGLTRHRALRQATAVTLPNVTLATSSPPCKSRSRCQTRNKSCLTPRRRRRSECWSAVRPVRRQPDRQIAGDLGELSGLRIDLDNPLGADLGHDQFAIGRQRDAFGHFQVLGDNGFLAIASNPAELAGKRLRDVDVALRTADQSDRSFQAADQNVAVLAVFAAGANKRFAAELA